MKESWYILRHQIIVTANPVVSGLLGLRVRISPVAYVFVFYECCVLLSRGLYEGPFPCPEESYRTRGVSECDREASMLRRLRATRVRS